MPAFYYGCVHISTRGDGWMGTPMLCADELEGLRELEAMSPRYHIPYLRFPAGDWFPIEVVPGPFFDNFRWDHFKTVHSRDDGSLFGLLLRKEAFEEEGD